VCSTNRSLYHMFLFFLVCRSSKAGAHFQFPSWTDVCEQTTRPPRRRRTRLHGSNHVRTGSTSMQPSTCTWYKVWSMNRPPPVRAIAGGKRQRRAGGRVHQRTSHLVAPNHPWFRRMRGWLPACVLFIFAIDMIPTGFWFISIRIGVSTLPALRNRVRSRLDRNEDKR